MAWKARLRVLKRKDVIESQKRRLRKFGVSEEIFSKLERNPIIHYEMDTSLSAGVTIAKMLKKEGMKKTMKTYSTPFVRDEILKDHLRQKLEETGIKREVTDEVERKAPKNKDLEWLIRALKIANLLKGTGKKLDAKLLTTYFPTIQRMVREDVQKELRRRWEMGEIEKPPVSGWQRELKKERKERRRRIEEGGLPKLDEEGRKYQAAEYLKAGKPRTLGEVEYQATEYLLKTREYRNIKEVEEVFGKLLEETVKKLRKKGYK